MRLHAPAFSSAQTGQGGARPPAKSRTCRTQHVLPGVLHGHLHHWVCAVQQAQALHQGPHLCWVRRLHRHPHDGGGLQGRRGSA